MTHVACTECHLAKRACEYHDDAVKCVRCTRLGIECTSRTNKKAGRKRKARAESLSLCEQCNGTIHASNNDVSNATSPDPWVVKEFLELIWQHDFLV